MDTSGEFNKIIERYKLENESDKDTTLINDITDSCLSLTPIRENDDLNFIDVDALDFSNDETWLYSCKETCPPSESDPKNSVQNWLRQNINTGTSSASSLLAGGDSLSSSPSQTYQPKNSLTFNKYDTKTFTRPKKRLTLESDDCDSLEIDATNSGFLRNANRAPLEFDLSQPVNNFEKILETAAEYGIDSFQNMSPPSLCSNSMCSSIMTNVMESSYTRADLDLESDSVLISGEERNVVTYLLKEEDRIPDLTIEESSKYNTYNKHSSAFLKSRLSDELSRTKENDPNRDRVLHSTFTAAAMPPPPPLTETTFNIPNDSNKSILLSNTTATVGRNSTFSKSPARPSFNSTFQKLSDSQPDLTSVHKPLLLKRNKASSGNNNRSEELLNVGSTDSLDERLSSFSDGGKDTPHIFNVEDWEAIAKSQELSLQQGIVSTPKPSTQKISRLFNDNIERFISPIVKTTLSDSDVSLASSAEECNTLHSGSSKTSSHGSLSSATLTRPLRTLQRPEAFVKPAPVTGDRKMLGPAQVVNNTAGMRSIPTRATKPSGLPRPATSTGIPRPTSRIPAPRFARPSAPRSLIQRSNPGSKTSLNEKHY